MNLLFFFVLVVVSSSDWLAVILLQEAEKYRSEYNKLRYDYTFLQSQWEQQREEHSRVLEERRICYEAEVGCDCACRRLQRRFV